MNLPAEAPAELADAILSITWREWARMQKGEEEKEEGGGGGVIGWGVAGGAQPRGHSCRCGVNM